MARRKLVDLPSSALSLPSRTVIQPRHHPAWRVLATPVAAPLLALIRRHLEGYAGTPKESRDALNASIHAVVRPSPSRFLVRR